MDDHDTIPRASDPSRRTALRMGAAVAWTVPIMTVVGTSPAHADRASAPGGTVVTPPPSEPTPPPEAPEPTATEPPEGGVLPDAQESEPTPAAAPVAGRAAAPELARTGSEAGTMAIAGVGLIAGGAAVYAASQRLGPDAPSGSSQI